MSVVYGSADSFVDSEWTAAAVERACALGDHIVWRREENKGHLDLDSSDQTDWLSDRFTTDTTESDC